MNLLSKPLLKEIRGLQAARDWNDTQLAAAVKLAKSDMSNILAGKRGLPLAAIRKLYKLGVPAQLLLAEPPKPRKKPNAQSPARNPDR